MGAFCHLHFKGSESLEFQAWPLFHCNFFFKDDASCSHIFSFYCVRRIRLNHPHSSGPNCEVEGREVRILVNLL